MLLAVIPFEDQGPSQTTPQDSSLTASLLRSFNATSNFVMSSTPSSNVTSQTDDVINSTASTFHDVANTTQSPGPPVPIQEFPVVLAFVIVMVAIIILTLVISYTCNKLATCIHEREVIRKVAPVLKPSIANSMLPAKPKTRAGLNWRKGVNRTKIQIQPSETSRSQEETPETSRTEKRKDSLDYLKPPSEDAPHPGRIRLPPIQTDSLRKDAPITEETNPDVIENRYKELTLPDRIMSNENGLSCTYPAQVYRERFECERTELI
ncbi:Hypp3274 [Branchiostoma lanceolatum]|uniref:Hypp3274 protein n=1 Tax=Branchiostoma lanceolatum TaxID=7740 RepID=A0A8K0A3M0_BRALA|nr:Hypp3274 [Branchiostoma lanceolatum]